MLRLVTGFVRRWFASGPHRYPFAHYLDLFASSYEQLLAILMGVGLGLALAGLTTRWRYPRLLPRAALGAAILAWAAMNVAIAISIYK